MTKYGIHNPTKSPRAIRDGITNSKRIEILPGATIINIELSDSVASRLLAVKGDLELTVIPGTEAAEISLQGGSEVPVIQPGVLNIDEAGVTVIKAAPAKPEKKTLSMPNA